MIDYLCSSRCGLKATAKIGEVLDRAPRPHTARELAEITGMPEIQVLAFLKSNKANDKITARWRRRDGGGRPMLEYWRGQAGVAQTFRVDNMMDDRTEDRLKNGKRPVSWRDNNQTAWSIDEANTVATMRGGSVVRLGKLEGISYSKQGVTIRVKDTLKITFRRQ